ncbi:mobilisation protein (MobC) [Mucilaginibacter pineti]|uniref:Mobilisation protein (MobC) n=2 Tax=Mucilaginibacter pineti TaxID=1391627 RepID=A0A1G7N8K6_9SPHI|nr:mobilisation protein (MobC) [Mucilaginibacter pineti]
MGTKLKGRPQLTEGKRIKKIDARFTEKEYAVVLDLEKQLDIRKTDLIRLRVLHQAQHVLVNAKEMISLLDKIGAELGRSGNNINQLARYANILKKQGTLSPVVAERFNFLFAIYLEQQKTLEVALRKIIRMLGT